MYPALLTFFIVGYIAIIFEKFVEVNKSATALLMGSIVWLIFFIETPEQISEKSLAHHFFETAQIISFLLAVMTIVELIDSHQGFKIVTDFLNTSSKRKLLWLLIFVSFFMSAILDNLTTMIVMISLLKKMVEDRYDRLILGSIMVISVNAGGAWTPIGDVTTTMLWINENITTWNTVKGLFLPSVANILVAGFIGTFYLKGESQTVMPVSKPLQPGARLVFFTGILFLILIPVWKALFNLPPFLGAMLGLGVLWLVTDILHFRQKDKRYHLRVLHILSKIDLSSILFFLGILLAINALDAAGLLKKLSQFLQIHIPDQNWVAVLIGLISSVIDNVPLVAATMGMYSLKEFPPDSSLWQMIAYAAGTGGSILIIGSAAGVAFMGLERVDFMWYMRKISLMALAGYFAGLGVYYLQNFI